MKEATKLGLARQLAPITQPYSIKIQGWMKRVTASGILLAGHRMDPLCILVSGKPGVGKSYMLNQFVRDVGNEFIPWGTLPNESIQNHVYMRNPQEDFWSGYKGQFATAYDDFGQMTESESSHDPSFLELIQAVGDNAFKIPMADIEEKNRGYFRSQMIICTTNMTSFSHVTIKSVREPNALARRFDLHVEMLKDKDDNRVFQMKLDGLDDLKLTYDELVVVARAKLAIKRQKYNIRSQEAETRDSPIQHNCVARFMRQFLHPQIALALH
jgi:hypothetical protein